MPQLCYGHKSSMGTVWRPFHQISYDSAAPGRRQEESYDFLTFLDIVRCPVKFRYYCKFHDARTAFGRVIEGKMKSAGHRTVPGRRPAGVCTNRTGTGRLLLKMYIVRFQRCPSWHRTVPSRTSHDVCQAAINFKNLLTNRTMPVLAPDDARPGTGRCFMSRTATGEKRRVFAEVHIVFT